MIVYSLFFLFITSLFSLQVKSNSILRSCLDSLIFASLFFFAGLRGLTGSDTPGYLAIFRLSANLSDNIYLFLQTEPIFLVVNFLISSVSDRPYFFLLSFSAIQVVLLYFIYRQTQNRLFLLVYIFLFYLNFHFNTVRAGTACLLLLCAFSAKNNYLKILCAMAAPGFHVSIVIFYPLLINKLSYRYLCLGLMGLMGFYFYFTDVVQAFYNKMFFYVEFNQEFSRNPSLLSLLIGVYILFCMMMLRPLNFRYMAAGLLLIFLYAISGVYPVLYRLITLAQVVYFYFLLGRLDNYFLQRKKFFVFWPLFILLFLLNMRGIFLESEELKNRINTGELDSGVLESTYIPYKLYWLDDAAQKF